MSACYGDSAWYGDTHNLIWIEWVCLSPTSIML
jgi:hypothetical protein